MLNVNGYPESITIKYFEKGHTLFMSADSFHHQIKKEMRSKKNVYDFDDFEKIIESKSYNLPMTEGYSYDCENGLSQRKFHYPSLYYAMSRFLCSRNQKLKCSGKKVTSKKSSNRVSF